MYILNTNVEVLELQDILKNIIDMLPAELDGIIVNILTGVIADGSSQDERVEFLDDAVRGICDAPEHMVFNVVRLFTVVIATIHSQMEKIGLSLLDFDDITIGLFPDGDISITLSDEPHDDIDIE